MLYFCISLHIECVWYTNFMCMYVYGIQILCVKFGVLTRVLHTVLCVHV